MAAHACHPSVEEVEEREPIFRVILCYIASYLKTNLGFKKLRLNNNKTIEPREHGIEETDDVRDTRVLVSLPRRMVTEVLLNFSSG